MAAGAKTEPIATRQAYGDALVELGETYEDVVALDAVRRVAREVERPRKAREDVPAAAELPGLSVGLDDDPVLWQVTTIAHAGEKKRKAELVADRLAKSFCLVLWSYRGGHHERPWKYEVLNSRDQQDPEWIEVKIERPPGCP